MDDWTTYQHPEYQATLPKWRWSRDHYTGEVLGPTVTSYLIRKATAETQPAYKERCLLADYTPHFATVVDSLAGMLYQNEQDANRTWGTDTNKGLGDETDPNTTIGQLWNDADGSGTGYLTLWKQLTTELILTHAHWVLVDSVDGNPQIRLIPPESVPNWMEGKTGLTEVLVKEDFDSRVSLSENPKDKTVQRFVHYTLQGWQRYEEKKGPMGPRTVKLGGKDNSGTYSFTDRSDRPALPIYRIRLPMNRPVGWLMAKKANAIFNKESERDHLLRYANFPKLCLDEKDDTLCQKLVDNIQKGTSILQGAGHVFIAPDTGPATIATEVLKRKVEEFYITAFREYGDAARQRTATEVRQDVSSGVGAFLSMLKSALEDAENEALWRIEEIEFADKAKWFVAHVQRSDEFIPQDVNATIERTRSWFFGKDVPVPLGRTAQIEAAKQVADYAGVEVDEAEIGAGVDLANLLAAKDLLTNEPIPATARGMLVVRMLEVLGVVKPEDTMLMADGSKTNLKKLLLDEAIALADNQAQQASQAASFFNAPPNSNPQPNTPPPNGNAPPQLKKPGNVPPQFQKAGP